MMGHQPRREALFHYFNLEDEVLPDHLLRLIGDRRGAPPRPV